MTLGPQVDTAAAPTIPPACLRRFCITPVRYLGGRANRHWLAERNKTQFVLRRYADVSIDSVRYEHAVMHRLNELGWPVPVLVEEPLLEAGRIWCLFTLLPGESRPEQGADDRRARGRLLAKLHLDTSTLTDLGQRSGFAIADQVAGDSELHASIRAYEQLRPTAGHVLRWHLDAAGVMFDHIRLAEIETIVLHSDFAPWNLLYDGGKLSGILDFESTHLNYRVSDFALAWRGYQHEVIEGYEEIHPLTDVDRQLLVPAFWSWLFLGVKEQISDMIEGTVPPHDFEWPIKQLLKRSPLHDVKAYPGAATR